MARGAHGGAGGIRLKLHVAATVLALALLAPSVVSLTPPTVRPGEPVLPEGTEWVATEWGYQRTDLVFPPGEWPIVLTMEGYAGAGRPNAYLRLDDGVLLALRIRFGEGPDGAYARVNASIRGTECSGGQFHLYDRRHAWDGHQAIEWMAAQPWSNGNVGMIGHSYSGQTAFWTATTQPPSLKAVSPNLLHSDIYRDIFMPGGIQNYAFPVVWTYGAPVSGPHRYPHSSVQNGAIPEDEICTQNQAQRTSPWQPPQPQLEPIWRAISPTDDMWYATHAATTYAGLIRIPYYQQNNWHDEQTGPRAAVLWHFVHPDPVSVVGKDGVERTVVPKVMRTSNGDHGWGSMASNDQWAWFDIWLRGKPDVRGILDAPVVNYFEISEDGATYSATKSGADWPFPDTTWTRLYARAGGALDAAPPPAGEAPDAYVSGAPRQMSWFWYAGDAGASASWSSTGADAVAYVSPPLAEEMVIAGPILAEVYASLSGTDSDFYVTLSDVHPDGSVSYLQRGLLKASHRAVDRLRSWHNADGEMVQPYRPHTNPQPVVPGSVEKYEIEVFPVGHVFRPGHRILVQVHTPPIVDGLWGFTPTQHQPGLVTVWHDAARPTSILLPVVTPDDGHVGPAPPDCRVPGGFPCAKPAA